MTTPAELEALLRELAPQVLGARLPEAELGLIEVRPILQLGGMEI